MSTPQSSLHSAFAVLDSGRELRMARAEVETKAPERTSALPRSEREHCDVVDIIPAIVWSALPDGSNVYVNSRFVEYSGMSAEQLAGSGWHAATHPDDLQRHERKWLACVRTCDVFEDEVRFRRANGQYRWHLQRGVPLRDEDGNILKWYGVLTDIEDRKRAEEKVQEQEIELRQILDLVPQLIAVYGPNQERLYANRNALEYLGMSLDEWLQTPSGADVHPDDVEKLWAFEDRGSSSYDLEVRVRKGDGSFRWFLIRFSALRDEKGQLMRWYVACTEIEDRKRPEEKQENVAVREEIDKASMFEEIVGTSSSLKGVLSRIAKVAPTDSTVLITGEPGTGRELIARAVHKRSQRSARPFVSVDCAALAPTLVSSELFGHEKGAFMHVLIVESHPILREGLATIINQQADMRVVGQAAYGRETLHAFQTHQPDITLLDLRLPDISGIETMISLRAAFPNSRIVILTNSAADFDIRRALEAGADGYVLKSMPPAELIQTMRCVHAGKKHFPPAVAACLAEYFADENLTKRERQVLESLAAGHRNRDIGAQLFIAEETVKVHIKHIMQKLRARDRTQAVVNGLRRGFISL